MVFKLKNFIVSNTFKHVYNNLYKQLNICFIQQLKKYFLNKIYIKAKTEYITCLPEFLCFKLCNISTHITDTIQKFNSKALIYLPIKYTDTIYGKKKLYYLILGDVPIYDEFKNFLINGLKKTFISKLTINKNNIFFNSFIKKSTYVYYAKLILSEHIFLNIILEDDFCYILYNKVKITFIDFIYILGGSLQDVFIFSRYNKSYILSKILLNNTNTDITKYSAALLYLKYFLSTQYTLNNINLYKIKSDLGSLSLHTSFMYDFIYIVDILLDLNSGKRNIKEIYNYEYRYIETINTYYSNYFKKYVNTNIKSLKLDLISFIKKNKKNELNKYIQPKKSFKFKEFLTINPLVQYIEQINSFSELAHKNRVSNYNLKTTQNLSIRDIHLNQLGSLCLIDTTESINCGLVVSFSRNIKTYINNNTFPYSFVHEYKSKQPAKYMTFSGQEMYYLIFNNLYLRKNKLLDYHILCLNKSSFNLKQINLFRTIYIKPQNMFSFAENIIPFLYFNEPTRCLMAAKMQLQSVPTLKKNTSYIITGYEKDSTLNSNNTLISFQEGVVINVTSYKIVIRDILNRKIIYYLNKYKKSNQNTIIHQKPIVWVGERIFVGQHLTETQDIINSEFTVGNNLIINYGNFYGYNFEDAIVLNKRVLYKQIFTSLHFSVYETTYSILKDNTIEIPTIHVPKRSLIQKRNLNHIGIIKEGSKVLINDILFSKININKINIKLHSLSSLIHLLFGNNLREVKDLSTNIFYGNSGRVVKTELYSTSLNEFNNNSYLKIRVYICKQRMLSVGDKLCGRYGNKGVIAYIVSNNEVPFSSNGYTPDIITDALGIPSRLNIGQLFESLFGLNCYINNKRMCITNTFNIKSTYYKTLIYNTLRKNQLIHNTFNTYSSYSPGKIVLKDGRTGFKFNEPSFLGVSKYSKLIHMVKDKIHYRVIGPYTELIQQPVKGRSNMGGQRFGEMEVWALQAYGASYNLRELLNYKSDDIQARLSIQNKILYKENLSGISMPESFRSLIRELNGMSLNIEAFSVVDNLEDNIMSVNINY